MRRRDFIALVGGAPIALSAPAQGQSGRVYRVGTLLPGPPMLPTEGGRDPIREPGKTRLQAWTESCLRNTRRQGQSCSSSTDDA